MKIFIGVAVVLVIAAVVWYVVYWRKRSQEQASDDATQASNEDTQPIVRASASNGNEKTVIDDNEADGDDQIPDDGWPVIRVGTSSICGSRKNQQDSLYCSEWKNRSSLTMRGLLAAVADGIGGLSNGDLASMTVAQSIRASFLSEDGLRKPAEEILYAAANAQKKVLELNRSGKMCGSTLVSVLIKKWSMWLLSIGDSRIALYRAGVLLTLNREHIMLRDNDEERAINGMTVPSDAHKNKALTSFVGKENLRQIDRTLEPMRLLPGDKIVLMSDGVFGTVNEDEMCAALACPPEEAALRITALIEAKNKPAQDNATIIVIGLSIA